jgi:nucleotide-binding universal stress UspA family protein
MRGGGGAMSQAVTVTVVVPLVGTWRDAEDVSEQALPAARSLARATAAEVLLLSVMPQPEDGAAESGASEAGSGTGQEPGERPRVPIDLPAIVRQRAQARRDRDREREDAAHDPAEQQAYLDRVAATFPASVTVQTRIASGHPARAIVRVAQEYEAPVVVMASHARAGVRRLVQGSVAFQVVRAAPCPVLVVAHVSNEWVSAETPSLGRVLVPLDGSLLSEYILEAGLAALGPAAKHLHLLRVVDPESSPSSLNVIDFIEETSTAAEDYIDGIAEQLTQIGYEVSCEIRTGLPEEEILAAAREFHADLIAMATHAREGISLVFFGSVAERLAQSGTFPLLLARPSDAWLEEMELDSLSGSGH